MMQKEYPEECIRGVSDSNNLSENNTAIFASVFEFGQNHCNDGWIEESINWKDDKRAVNFTLKQKKRGENQFQYIAVAIIPRDVLDDIKKKYIFSNSFDYERSPIKKVNPLEKVNPYHGNLLMKKETERRLKTIIKSTLAYNSKIIMR